MMTRTITAAAVATIMAGMALSGCAIEKQEAPATSGPSEMAMSISVSASPEILRQDGVSRSTIILKAQDAKGQASRDLQIRLDIYVGNAIVDFGELSSKSVWTGTDGTATVLYTAPPAPTQAVDSQTVVRIVATPVVGTDYANAVERAVSIRLVPLGVVLPTNGAPVASFVVSPSAPLTQTAVTFDGSGSYDLDGRIVSYAWNFGDGSTGTGSPVQHQYALGGSYSVTLTVTDDRGLTNAKSQSITVADGGNPTAVFGFSPAAPRVNQQVFFNAAGSTAALGRTIARYDWDYGNGRQDSGQLAWEVFTKAGTYKVSLTVTDDAGKKGTKSDEVTVIGTTLAAVFTISPTAPTATDTVNFDASDSTSTYPIKSYAWDFGDNTRETGATATARHQFTCPGYPTPTATDMNFTVRLTIRDDQEQTATTTKVVLVKKCGL
jgi:PKD repeat protein